MREGIKAEEFWPELKRAVEHGRPGAGVTTLLAKMPGRGEIPVGWLIGWAHILGSARTLELRASWAPWATPRIKIESVVSFLLRARGLMLALWSCRRSEARLYEHACRYGLARTVGTVKALYGANEDGILFQSVEIR